MRTQMQLKPCSSDGTLVYGEHGDKHDFYKVYPKTRDEAMQQKKDKGWSIGEIRAYYNARIGTVNVCWSLEAVLLCIDSCVLLFFPWRGPWLKHWCQHQRTPKAVFSSTAIITTTSFSFALLRAGIIQIRLNTEWKLLSLEKKAQHCSDERHAARMVSRAMMSDPDEVLNLRMRDMIKCVHAGAYNVCVVHVSVCVVSILV